MIKRHAVTSLLLGMCVSFFGYAQAQKKAAPAGSQEKITVVSPLGNPPPIQLIPMAARPQALDGKTVYFVDDGFLGGDILLKEMMAWFAQSMPKVKTEFRKKAGGFAAEDPALWAEIKEKGDAMVMATGH
jgi:hypothetical protein